MQEKRAFQKADRAKHASLVWLFLLVATCFYLVRSTQGLVWNDSPQTAENLYGFQDGAIQQKDAAPICREDGAYGLSLGTPHLMKTVLTRAFSCLEFGGYRPLSAALSFTAVAINSEAYAPVNPKKYFGKIWVMGVAGLFGLLAVLFFLVAREYVQTDWAAYIILLLFFCSPPMVSGAWILFSGGIQVTVPLCICLGLWLYQKTIQAKRHQWLWQTGLVLALFLGPWVREFVGVVAVLIILSEFQKHRRPTGILVLAVLGFLHAVFPTALLHLFVPKLPVIPVFKLGSLAAQIGTASGVKSSLWAQLLQVKWDVAKVFLVLLPPSFIILSGLILVWSSRKNAKSLAVAIGLAMGAVLSIYKPWFSLFLIFAFCAMTLSGPLFNPRQSEDSSVHKVVFLNAWFLLSFLPFLKVFSAHVHLAYPLMPALILIISSTETFWLGLWNRKGVMSWRGAILFPIFFLCLMDQMLNVYGGYVTVNRLYSGVQYMADWFRAHTPAGTIVIANALHAEDIRLYSGNHILPYWSVGVGVPPERTLEKPSELGKFLQAHFGSKPILMLNMEQDFAPNKVNYHAHKYITRNTVKVASEGRIHSESGSVPFIDPLRNFFPRKLVLFLGPPDLENDVYYGRSGSHRFRNEVSVSYSVYTVLDPNVSQLAYYQPDSTFLHPQFLESYRGYRLCGYLDKLLAVPDSIPIEECRLTGSDHRIVAGSSVIALKNQIDGLVSP